MFNWFNKKIAVPDNQAPATGTGVPGKVATSSLPNEYAAHKKRGNEFLAQGRLEEATECYRQAIAVNPGHAEGFLNLGFSLKEQHLFEEAEQALKQAVLLDPQTVDAYYFLGSIAQELGNPPKAIEYFQKSLELKPDFEIVYGDLCQLLFQSGQLESATKVIQQGLSLFPQSAQFHCYLGNLYVAEKKLEQAVTCYRKALAIQPDYAGVPRSLSSGTASSFQPLEKLFIGKTGIEIGGPSPAFYSGSIFPVYPIVGHLDNCNFGNTTVWEGDIRQGQTFQFDQNKPAGQQYVIEATAMECLNSGAYDFVLSSHVLEHVANPILALLEWKRLLADSGTLVLLLPDKKHTFDHRRPLTTMAHLIADFEGTVQEDDLTHLPEILALHDFELSPEAGDVEAFKKRSMRNVENRCLHHHVFDMDLALNLVEHAGLSVLAAEEIFPHTILLVLAKNRA